MKLNEAIKFLKYSADTTLSLCFDFSYNRIGDEGAEFLAEAIIQNKTLTTLSLSLCSNNIGDEGAEFFGKAIGENKTLTTLSLYLISNDIEYEKLADIEEKIKEHIKKNRKEVHTKKCLHFLWCCNNNENLKKLSNDVIMHAVLPYLPYLEGGPSLKTNL